MIRGEVWGCGAWGQRWEGAQGTFGAIGLCALIRQDAGSRLFHLFPAPRSQPRPCPLYVAKAVPRASLAGSAVPRSGVWTPFIAFLLGQRYTGGKHAQSVGDRTNVRYMLTIDRELDLVVFHQLPWTVFTEPSCHFGLGRIVR